MIQPIPFTVFPSLSPREREVLDMIANGHTNQEISDALGITNNTTKNHITNIFIKLKVDNRTKAALVAVKSVSQS